MIIQANKPLAIATATTKFPAPAVAKASQTVKNSDTVTLSREAQAVLAAQQGRASSATSSAAGPADAKLAEIKAKEASSRTPEDVKYLWENDPVLAALQAKRQADPNYKETSAEIDYGQKVGGFVNTWAYLSAGEKELYDKAVASGNQDAAAAISMIALTRSGGHVAGGAPGTTYDPINTAITPDNIRKYFSYSIVDPTGKAQAQFQALIAFLENKPAASS